MARSGQWVVVSGAGRGLDHIAVQLAKRMGLRVIGIDHWSKKSVVKECGAESFVDITKYDDKSIVEEVKKTVGGHEASAVLVCTACTELMHRQWPSWGFGGSLVCVGVPEGKIEPLSSEFPASVVFKQPTIASTAVGNWQTLLSVRFCRPRCCQHP